MKIKVFDATFCEKDLSSNTAHMSSHPHNHLKVILLRTASFVLAGEVLVLRGNSKLEDNASVVISNLHEATFGQN